MITKITVQMTARKSPMTPIAAAKLQLKNWNACW